MLLRVPRAEPVVAVEMVAYGGEQGGEAFYKRGVKHGVPCGRPVSVKHAHQQTISIQIPRGILWNRLDSRDPEQTVECVSVCM